MQTARVARAQILEENTPSSVHPLHGASQTTPKKMDSAGPLNYDNARRCLPVNKPVGGQKGLKFHAKRGSHYDIFAGKSPPVAAVQQIGFPSGNGLHEIALVARAACSSSLLPRIKTTAKKPLRLWRRLISRGKSRPTDADVGRTDVFGGIYIRRLQ